MASPCLKDLPKVDMDLKSQLESFSPTALKSASTEEKGVLPTAEGKPFIEIEMFISVARWDKSVICVCHMSMNLN